MDNWIQENVYHEAEDFFFAILSAIDRAQSTVLIETYILETGRFAEELFLRLQAATQRGVNVRLMVDGVGSWLWWQRAEILPDSMELRCYHPLSRFRWINRRNHKKTIIIDGTQAFVGSLNITDVSFQWRETGARVEGPEVEQLVKAFFKVWKKAKSRDGSLGLPLPYRRRELRSRNFTSELVILNHSLILRQRAHRQWTQTLRRAQTRLWVTTPYFIATQRQLAILYALHKRGVDVRILVPEYSDLPWMKPLSLFLLQKLMRVGIQVFSYRPQVLHAKVVIVDQMALVGSSNWNHRSWFWDLEVDVRLTSEAAVQSLAQQFATDLEQAEPLQPVEGRLRAAWLVVTAFSLWLVRRFL